MRLFVLTLVLASGGFALAWSLAASSNGANCRHSHAPICATTATSGKTTTSTPAGSSGICGTYASQAAPATVSHVIWIWMENHSYSEIIGSSSAPYINRLASQCGLATNFFAESHPSLPNYIAATSGSTQGITDDALPSSHQVNVSSIFGQTSGWSFEESMPSNCYLTADARPYIVHHNPETYYTPIRTLCGQTDVPLSAFNPASLPSFSFVTPNNCDNMHDCSVTTGDSWLSTFIPRITSTADYQAGKTVIFLTWDEDDSTAGNHVATLVLSQWTAPGTRSSTSFNHYSLLRTTEELLGKALLANAAGATSMRSAFHL